jgi:hypothetical protein
MICHLASSQRLFEAYRIDAVLAERRAGKNADVPASAAASASEASTQSEPETVADTRGLSDCPRSRNPPHI